MKIILKNYPRTYTRTIEKHLNKAPMYEEKNVVIPEEMLLLPFCHSVL